MSGQTVATLFTRLPDEAVEGMLLAAAQQLRVQSGMDAATWAPVVLVPVVLRALAGGLDALGQTPAAAIARYPLLDAVGQLVAIVADVAACSRQSATAAAQTRLTTSAAGGATAVLRAAEGVAAMPAALAGVNDLLTLSRVADSDTELRAAAGKLELLSADVALLLHQEGLDRVPQTGALGAPTSGAHLVIECMYELRPRLEAARVRWLEEVCPKAVVAKTLVRAVQTGSLTVANITGLPASASVASQMVGLMKSWVCLVPLMRAMHPRDDSLEHAMLMIANEAFDIGSQNPANAMRAVVTPALAQLEKRYTAYLRGVGDAPKLEEVRLEAVAIAQRRVQIEGALLAETTAERARVAREAAAAKAKEAEDAKKVAAAPADGASEPEAVDGGTPSKKGKKK